MEKMIEKIAAVELYEKRIVEYQMAIKRFPQGEGNLDVWVMLGNDAHASTVDLIDINEPYAYECSTLLSLPNAGHNLDLVSFFVAAKEYAQQAEQYIKLLENALSDQDPEIKAFILKKLAEKI